MTDIEMVTLTSGREVPMVTVQSTSLSFHLLFKKNPIAAYDAVMMAQDENYQPFSPQIAREIEEFGLTQHGRMHRDTALILAASVTGEGLDMEIVNPLAK